MNVAKAIESIDWESFRTNVHCCVLDAFALYGLATVKPAPREPVFQVAIWTDIRAGMTAVSIETLAHARQAKAQLGEMMKSHGDEEGARIEASLPYNSNPANFLYPEFTTILHSELESVRNLAGSVNSDYRFAVEGAVETNLLTVVANLEKTWAFARVHREPQVWVGVSSPRDWYDHVRAV